MLWHFLSYGKFGIVYRPRASSTEWGDLWKFVSSLGPGKWGMVSSNCTTRCIVGRSSGTGSRFSSSRTLLDLISLWTMGGKHPWSKCAIPWLVPMAILIRTAQFSTTACSSLSDGQVAIDCKLLRINHWQLFNCPINILCLLEDAEIDDVRPKLVTTCMCKQDGCERLYLGRILREISVTSRTTFYIMEYIDLGTSFLSQVHNSLRSIQLKNSQKGNRGVRNTPCRDSSRFPRGR